MDMDAVAVEHRQVHHLQLCLLTSEGPESDPSRGQLKNQSFMSTFVLLEVKNKDCIFEKQPCMIYSIYIASQPTTWTH